MLGLTGSEILGLSVIAAFVTTVGNLLATWLRDFLFARSFERWKDRRILLSVNRKYRDPLLRAACDLLSRVKEICADYPTKYLGSSVLDQQPRQLEANSNNDPYYQRYKHVSTVYRLCAFLGWLELYRQELTFLDIGEQGINDRLEQSLEGIRNDLADGQLNTAPDWRRWSDRLIFKEEQRAIGEAMIVGGSARVVMGYATFHALFEHAEEDELWWLRVAKGFIADLQVDKDFRRRRFEMMRDHLDTTIVLLRPQGCPKPSKLAHESGSMESQDLREPSEQAIP